MSRFWRYIDIGKYLDLITRRELWFTRGCNVTVTRYIQLRPQNDD